MTPDLRLIVITDATLCRPRALRDVVEEALEAGAPAVQLRDKRASAAELFEQAIVLREQTRRHGALLFINDRLDVALAAHADGVHLGPHDVPVAAARSVAPDSFLIGYSTDAPDRARRAQAAGAAYVGCGAVFGTANKREVGDERIGVERLAEVVSAVTIPVIGIGGITPGNAADVAATGASGAAVIGAVMGAAEPAQAVHALLAPFPA